MYWIWPVQIDFVLRSYAVVILNSVHACPWVCCFIFNSTEIMESLLDTERKFIVKTWYLTNLTSLEIGDEHCYAPFYNIHIQCVPLCRNTVLIILPLPGLGGGTPSRVNARLQEETSRRQVSFVMHIVAAIGTEIPSINYNANCLLHCMSMQNVHVVCISTN